MSGSANYNKLGSYNIICDRCGQKRKREQCKFEWTGLLTCTQCWDPRHPWTEPLPVVIDGLPVPDARPRPAPKEIEVELSRSIWNVQYYTLSGLQPNIGWTGWNTAWDEGNGDLLPWSPANNPLQ